jgi:hypothetical protein
MNLKILLPVGALLGALLPAQNRQPPSPPSQEQLVKLRAEKLAKPVFTKAPWVTDYDKAREQAKKENKLLFTYFTRSYAA